MFFGKRRLNGQYGLMVELLRNHGVIDETLAYFKSNHIIVGHTSFETVTTHFGGKVIGVDSSIKNGVDGELLILENGKFYRGLNNGKKINF